MALLVRMRSVREGPRLTAAVAAVLFGLAGVVSGGGLVVKRRWLAEGDPMIILGDEVELCHDVHEQLTPQQAADLARQLQDFRLFFLEDPVRPDHKESFKLVREASTTPLAMGELFVSLGNRGRALEQFTAAADIPAGGQWGKKSEDYLKILQ